MKQLVATNFFMKKSYSLGLAKCFDAELHDSKSF